LAAQQAVKGHASARLLVGYLFAAPACSTTCWLPSCTTSGTPAGDKRQADDPAVDPGM
jgi:hypothetical protein